MLKLLVLAGACAALAGCGGSKSETTTPTQAAPGSGCFTVTTPIMGNRNSPPPTNKLDPAKNYDVTFRTNCGDFTIRIDPVQAPHAAASFIHLVKRRYYDTTVVHRTVRGVLIQAGDPTGSGTVGPGYSTVDKPAASATYTRGVVAMAKTRAEKPGTAGAQFFIVAADDAGLSPDYAIVGKVIKGMNVVDRIAALGTADETPSQIVEIESAMLKVSSGG